MKDKKAAKALAELIKRVEKLGEPKKGLRRNPESSRQEARRLRTERRAW